MVFRIEKFHLYTHGRRITVQSDHKLLRDDREKDTTECSQKTLRMDAVHSEV